ncbi:MAG TPA: glutathione peroxidase [Hanamia sp.]|nr:glutathione peroxidase [Hanamia sp.]
MKVRRKIMVLIYPFMMKILKLTGIRMRILKNENNILPPVSFYSLKAVLNNGEEISFEQFKNRKILIVNLASECAFTPQYSALENLFQSGQSLIILGFPSNDFGKQEPGNDKEIIHFCREKYGVTFPVFQKNSVSGKSRQTVYQWLTDKNKNGWNEEEPQWNFYKYLVDEQGKLAGVFSSAVPPEAIPV